MVYHYFCMAKNVDALSKYLSLKSGSWSKTIRDPLHYINAAEISVISRPRKNHYDVLSCSYKTGLGHHKMSLLTTFSKGDT